LSERRGNDREEREERGERREGKGRDTLRDLDDSREQAP
jgi:hypothetical protein